MNIDMYLDVDQDMTPDTDTGTDMDMDTDTEICDSTYGQPFKSTEMNPADFKQDIDDQRQNRFYCPDSRTDIRIWGGEFEILPFLLYFFPIYWQIS